MTRSDGMVSSGPDRASGESLDGVSRTGFARRQRLRRGLVVLPVALSLMLPVAPALGQTTGTSGYKQAPPAPKTTTTPKSGTAPSKEATTPAKTTPKAAVEPTTTTAPAKVTAAPGESKLPFTGLNLTWVVGVGALLLVAGLSIRVVQRRQRYDRR